MLRACLALYWLALTVWVSVLVSAGVAAIGTFGALGDPALGVRLDAFEASDAAHHGRIAAGRVMEPIFAFVDVVSVPAAVIVIAALLLQLTVFRMNPRSPANVVRSAAIVIAAALTAWRILLITPEMNRELQAYWNAAEAGEVVAADRHLASFNAGHRRARPMMNATLVLLLAAVAASGAAMTPGAGAKPAKQLQTPDLARKA